MEQKEEEKAKALATSFHSTLVEPYRWRDWAAPFDQKISYDETITKKGRVGSGGNYLKRLWVHISLSSIMNSSLL